MQVLRASSSLRAAAPRSRSAVPAVARPAGCRAPARRSTVLVRAEDFDAVLNKYAEKFEKAENKPVVIGYVAAAIGAFFTAEWLLHLPALDILLGFPVQLLGLLTLPYLGVRWFVDGEDAGKDIEAAAGTIIKKLPGLEKK